MTGVALLVPVGVDRLVVADLRGTLMLPVGGLHAGQTPAEAAHLVLAGLPGTLRLVRRVAVHRVQMRRRKVITHVLAAACTPPDAVHRLEYRDPRATVRVMPTQEFIDQLWTPARYRVLVSLQALATNQTAYIEDNAQCPSSPSTT
ncbi:hypothetical protein ACH4L5_36195 [Streptomyces sp. NPDC017405]|uniref:hypothetical protein n=1 Tax=unclassified Streptomyces TaxID=2593676 RepID=UPI0037B092D5